MKSATSLAARIFQRRGGLVGADHGLFIGKDSDVDSSGYEGIWLRRFDQGWAAPRER